MHTAAAAFLCIVSVVDHPDQHGLITAFILTKNGQIAYSSFGGATPWQNIREGRGDGVTNGARDSHGGDGVTKHHMSTGIVQSDYAIPCPCR